MELERRLVRSGTAASSPFASIEPDHGWAELVQPRRLAARPSEATLDPSDESAPLK